MNQMLAHVTGVIDTTLVPGVNKINSVDQKRFPTSRPTLNATAWAAR